MWWLIGIAAVLAFVLGGALYFELRPNRQGHYGRVADPAVNAILSHQVTTKNVRPQQ